MSAMNKDLLHQGFNFATACYDVGIDATPITTWLGQQGKLMAEPTAANAGTGTGLYTTGTAGNFDQAVLAAVQSSPALGLGMTDLRPILAQYNRPNNQIGAALGRLQKKGLIAKKGDLWTSIVDKSLDTRRRTRTARKARATGSRKATAAAQGAEQQQLAGATA